MARPNYSSPNKFDSRIYRGPRPGGLLGMLQSAMQEQSLQQQRADYAPQPGASPVDSSDTPPGGLLGRWLALQAAQQRPLSFGEDRRRMPSAPADPNFRRLVRVSPAVQPQGGDGVSNRFPYSAFGDGIPSDAPGTSDFGRVEIAEPLASQEESNRSGSTASAGYGWPTVSDASPDPIRPGSHYAQGQLLCLGGPGLCAVGTGQAILGGVAALLGGATILKQNKLPVPGRPASTPTGKSGSETGVVPRTDQSSEGGALVEGGDNQNPCRDRWLGEHYSCDRFWRPRTTRFQRACEARAADRLRLCHRNGGTPNPEEPAEYSWKDIARDRFRR